MRDETKKVIEQTKRWLEQERVWDDALYASNLSSRGESAAHASERRGDLGPVKITSQIAASAPSKEVKVGPPRNDPERAAALKALYEKYKDCTRCPLGHTRIKFVFGVGPADAEAMFIGEGPGYEEDRRGEPFVGKAGQLLDKMLAAIQMSRQTNAFIANIVKCHPMANPQTPEARGNDRAPNPEEVETCSPILLRQIAVLQPRIIVTLGSPSTKMILRTKEGITGLRGKFFPFPADAFYPESQPSAMDMFELNPGAGDADSLPPVVDPATREALRRIQVLPTYHPAALLRNPNLKPESWADLKLLRDALTQRP
jgi:uracil-DNA glycosylase